MKKILGILCLTILIFGCQTQPKIMIKEIDISQSYLKDKEVRLSEIANDISYIKLQTDTNCFIDKIRDPFENIQFSKDRIFISDRNNLFSFDYSGKFLTKIGRQGRGPGEFTWIDDFTILQNDNLVVVFSAPQRRAFIYNFDNTFIKTIAIDFWPTSLSSLNQEFLVFGSAKGRRSETDYYTLSVVNKEGEILSHLINNQREKEIEKKVKLGLTPICHFYNFYDTLSYWEFQYDTIWRVFDEKLAIPEYYINTGPKKLPFELLLTSPNRVNELNNYVKIEEFVESKRYLFLKVGYENYLKHILYDKQSKQSYNVAFAKDQEYMTLSFINDIDGGFPFWPLGNVAGNRLFSLIYGYEFRAKLKNQKVYKNDPQFEKNNQKLLELIENSNETDNPIIMIVSIKE